MSNNLSIKVGDRVVRRNGDGPTTAPGLVVDDLGDGHLSVLWPRARSPVVIAERHLERAK